MIPRHGLSFERHGAVVRANYLIERTGGKVIACIVSLNGVANDRHFGIAGPIAKLVDENVLVELDAAARCTAAHSALRTKICVVGRVGQM